MMTDAKTEQIQGVVKSVNAVLTGMEFPARMVLERYRYSYIFDFETVFAENYFETLKGLMTRRQTCFILVVLDPDPFEYFLKNFHCLPAIEITNNCSFEDYIRELNSAPAVSPADAIIDNSEKIIIVDDVFESVFIFLRSYEIGAAYFSSGETMLAARQMHTYGIIDPENKLTVPEYLAELVEEYARTHSVA